MAKEAQGFGMQYAALPFRIGSDGLRIAHHLARDPALGNPEGLADAGLEAKGGCRSGGA